MLWLQFLHRHVMRHSWSVAAFGPCMFLMGCDSASPTADDSCLVPVGILSRPGPFPVGDTLTMIAIRDPCGIGLVNPIFTWTLEGPPIIALSPLNDSSVLVQAVAVGTTGVSLMGSYVNRPIQVLETRQVVVVADGGVGAAEPFPK